MPNKNTKKYDTMRTVYIVRDAGRRVFLNRRAYTGRSYTIWGNLDEAHIFYRKAQAQSCASNINARNNGTALDARVVRVRVPR